MLNLSNVTKPDYIDPELPNIIDTDNIYVIIFQLYAAVHVWHCLSRPPSHLHIEVEAKGLPFCRRHFNAF